MKDHRHLLIKLSYFLLLSLPTIAMGKEFTGYVSDRLTTLLYANPDSQKIVTHLDAGQEITVIATNKESWNQIRLKDGTIGWIESEYITSNPGRLQQIFTLNKERLSLQQELTNHKKETLFLQQQLQQYRSLNLNLKKRIFNQKTKINRFEEILAAPLKINQENLHLKKSIEFLKFDNSILQRSLKDIGDQNKSDWQALILICSIIFLFVGYIIGKRLSANKKASWDI